MDLDGVQKNLADWSTYTAKSSKPEKSKDVFLKVHDGKLTYEAREALPTGIKWLKTRGEYDFSKNIQQLKEVLTTAHKNIASLKPDEREKLQELHKLYDNLVARYQEKATPGVIGRLLIFLGVKDYKAEIQKAVNDHKLPFLVDVWMKSQSPSKGGQPQPVEVRSDLMRQASLPKARADEAPSALQTPPRAAILQDADEPVTPKTPTEIGQAAVRGILMGSIDAFSKAAATRQAELFCKNPAAADQIAEQLKELVRFREGITSSNAGEKLEEFHRKFEATKLPEVSTPEEREARAQLKKEKAELLQGFQEAKAVLESIRRENPDLYAEKYAPLALMLASPLDRLGTFDGRIDTTSLSPETLQTDLLEIRTLLGKVIEQAQAIENQVNAPAEASQAALDMAELDGVSGANQPHFQEISHLPPPADIEESDEAVLEVESAKKSEASKTFSEVSDEIQVLSEKADLLEALRKGKELPPHKELSRLKRNVERLKWDLENLNGGEFPAQFLERLQIADALLYAIQLDTYK